MFIFVNLSSVQDRIDAGMPTALAVSSMIAVGTSHGLVLIFGMVEEMLFQ